MLRRVRDAPLGGARIDPTVAIALLQQAAVHGKDVLMGYVDAAGVATPAGAHPDIGARWPPDGFRPGSRAGSASSPFIASPQMAAHDD